LHYRDASVAAGAFCLTGLPATALELVAQHRLLGETSTTLQGIPGVTLTWDVRLVRGLELRGRLVSDAGEPVPWVGMYASCGDWSKGARAGSDGCFTIANCPTAGLLTLQSHDRRVEPFKVEGLDPRAGEVVVRVRRIDQRQARGRLAGRVLDPDGRPVGNAIVTPRRAGGPRSGQLAFSDKETGQFSLVGLPEGTYRVQVAAHGFPDATSADHVLAADADLDIGTVQLVPGGVVAVSGIPADATGIELEL